MENKIDFDRIERRAAARKRTFRAVDYFFLVIWALMVLFLPVVPVFKAYYRARLKRDDN